MSDEVQWKELGRVAPDGLNEVRLALHWAAQVVSSVGATLLAPAPDDSHTNLEWLPRFEALAGRATERGLRAALRIRDLNLLVIDGDGAIVVERAFSGHTLDEMMDGLSDLAGSPLKRPSSVPPEHPVSAGHKFASPDPAALEEMSRWFGDAAIALEELVATNSEASDVRCWPHHFDIALLIQAGVASDGAPQTIGVGMTPGDENIPEPYWYVTPWPVLDRSDLPQLDSGGEWRTDEWFGALLRGTRVVEAGDGSLQHAAVRAFLQSAVAAGHQLLR